MVQNLHRIHENGVQNLQVTHTESLTFRRRILTTLIITYSSVILCEVGIVQVVSVGLCVCVPVCAHKN